MEACWWCDCIHRKRVLASDLDFKISCSSWRLYCPFCKHVRSTVLSMTLVRASAIWAPDGTHLIWIPFCKCSLINFACNNVRNSVQDGGAFLLIRSNKDLQSGSQLRISRVELFFLTWFTAWGMWVLSAVSGVKAEKAGVISSGFHQLFASHISGCKAMPNKVSPRIAYLLHQLGPSILPIAYSLQPTFWIFLECQTRGLTGRL